MLSKLEIILVFWFFCSFFFGLIFVPMHGLVCNLYLLIWFCFFLHCCWFNMEVWVMRQCSELVWWFDCFGSLLMISRSNLILGNGNTDQLCEEKWSCQLIVLLCYRGDGIIWLFFCFFNFLMCDMFLFFLFFFYL